MIEIDIVNEQDKKQIEDEHIELIKKVVQMAANIEGIDDSEVVVTLVDDETIHQLNKNYRNIDRPTDVLSFAMNEEGEEEMDILFDDDDESDYPNALGDIIISIPRAMEQAKDYNHTFERELGFLAVHGFLHLIGYDHETEEEEKIMFGKQEDVLQELNLLR